GMAADEQIVARVLRAVDAEHLSGRSYLQLSGGERQRVHLARVLAQLWPGADGQVLLLDEPTSMLDPLHQLSVLDAVRRFADQGASVLIILHDLNLAARYCDQLLLLGNGGVQASGTPEQVLQPEPLNRSARGRAANSCRYRQAWHPSQERHPCREQASSIRPGGGAAAVHVSCARTRAAAPAPPRQSAASAS